MSFGEGLAGFFEGYTTQKNTLQEQQRRDKIAKLQGDLVTLQLKGAETKLAAQTQVADMIGGTVEEFKPSTGSIEDRTGKGFTSAGREPMGLAEMMATGQGQSALMQADPELFRSLQPKASARQNSKIEQLNYLEQMGITVDPDEKKAFMLDTASEDLWNKVLGVEGLFGDKSNMIITGITTNQDGNPQVTFGRNPENVTPQQAESGVFGLQQVNKVGGDILKHNDSLRASNFWGMGTSVAGQARDWQGIVSAVGDKFGLTSPEYKKALSDFDELEKSYAIIAAETMAGADTDTARRAALATTPTTDKTPEANANIVANYLEGKLNDPKNQKLMLPPQVAELEKTISGLREFGKGEVKEPVFDVKKIASMSKEKINELVKSGAILQFTEEQLNALEARYAELNK